MSQSRNQYEAERWLLTAEEDLRAAETLSSAEIFSLACFHAQQAGDKAVKALWRLIDADPWGHSVKKLISDFPSKDEIQNLQVLTDKAALLDKFYIPTRYPNGLPDLTPGQIYVREDADQGIEAARMFVSLAENWLRKNASNEPG
jgi:HEPN domain-containing protein